MNKKILITASALGILSIALGAFGAHGLKELITVNAIQTFEIGVRYQMYHAFFLLFVGNTSYVTIKTKKIVYYLTLIGVLFFSGSIYGLATNDLTNFDFNFFGFITPLGGFFLILAWVFVFIDFIKMSSKNQ
ncbi:DUF423 domain-containing protein [Litoribaculum gwangyangense]|uniref:DUF423 domain-containing protein n=1 Tax=Litoribaculum gwangyangense TaxID=1130722 RepID=A0ABP9C3Z3_9FLAO